MLTGAETTPTLSDTSGYGVTRATFVSINTGPADDASAKGVNSKVEPAENPVEKKIAPPREPEKKEAITDIPAEKPEPVGKKVVKPEKKPVEKKKENPVKKTAPAPEVKKPPVKKADPEPLKDEPEVDMAPEKQDKTSPAESEENTGAEQPGETYDKAQGTQDNSADRSSGEVNPNPGAEALSKNINRIHDVAEGDITRRVTPDYPRASRLRREEGQVVIVAEIKNGKAVKVSIESSSGHQRLDRSALEAVKKWEFAFRNARTVRIPVIFRLRD